MGSLPTDDCADGLLVSRVPYFYGPVLRACNDDAFLFVHHRHSPNERRMPFQHPYISALVLQRPNPESEVIKLPTRRHHQLPDLNDTYVPMIRFTVSYHTEYLDALNFPILRIPSLDRKIITAGIQSILLIMGE